MSGENNKGKFWTKGKAITAGVLTGIFGIVSIVGYAGATRVTDREAAVKIVRGKLVDDNVSTGLKFSSWLPQVEFIKYPLFLQKVPVSATERDDVTIRTKEKARIYGTFEVHYVLNRDHPDFGNLYTELKADDMEDLTPFISNYTVPAAIDVYKNVPTAELNDQLTDGVDNQGNVVKGVSTKLMERLQEILNDRGYGYITVKDVIPSGVGLSDQANSDLEKIVSEERKLDLLKVQGTVADQSIAIVEKQATVTARALQTLREAGIPEEDLLEAYYIQLMRDNDRIGLPFVAIPFGEAANALPAVVVDEKPSAPVIKRIAPPPAPKVEAPAPAPGQ